MGSNWRTWGSPTRAPGDGGPGLVTKEDPEGGAGRPDSGGMELSGSKLSAEPAAGDARRPSWANRFNSRELEPRRGGEAQPPSPARPVGALWDPEATRAQTAQAPQPQPCLPVSQRLDEGGRRERRWGSSCGTVGIGFILVSTPRRRPCSRPWATGGSCSVRTLLAGGGGEDRGAERPAKNRDGHPKNPPT